MNLNTSVESHTILMEQPSALLNLTKESLAETQLQLEHIMQQMIQLPTMLTGIPESNPILMPSVLASPPKNEINSANPSSSLRSNVKPHVLLERPPEVRVLKVSEADIKALGQVISEFQEQFST